MALLGITKGILEYEMIKLRFVKNTKRLNKIFTFSFFAFCYKNSVLDLLFYPRYNISNLDIFE